LRRSASVSSERALGAIALALSLAACARASFVARVIPASMGSLFESPRQVPDKVTRPVRSDARLAALWVGHATVLLQMDDKLLMTDPVFTRTVGQLSARLVEPGIELASVPRLDAVLISHMHFDHLSLGSLEELEPKIDRLFVPQGGLVYVPNFAFDARELGAWQSFEWDGVRLTAVPVSHVGFRYGPDAPWMTASFTGYIVEYRGLTVYFGGDTAYDRALFEETRRRFPHIDLALLPIAPIHPRDYMRRTHVDAEEALDAFRDLGAKRLIPIHYDTFINSLDAAGEPKARLLAGMKRRGLGDEVCILTIGEQRVLIERSLDAPR
jgi:N-acyl-phosphatidylethanolamine-hydrolysing phospholipase D